MMLCGGSNTQNINDLREQQFKYYCCEELYVRGTMSFLLRVVDRFALIVPKKVSFLLNNYIIEFDGLKYTQREHMHESKYI